MNIAEYQEKLLEFGYDEHPKSITGQEVRLEDFIKFEQTDIELRLYLCQLILCRCFYGTFTGWIWDVRWFIDGFLKEYRGDINRPELSATIREAADMIISDDVFKKRIIGTTFMFGVVEFYIKFFLGFRPMDVDFFDNEAKRQYIKMHDASFDTKKRELTISKAMELLQRTSLPVAVALNEIDRYTASRLKAANVKQGRWVKDTISKRLSLIRNPMLHGEVHSFYSIGDYLIMIYSLFHLHDLHALRSR